MKLSHIFLLAHDVDQLARFYALVLGLKIAHQEPGAYAFFNMGAVRLAIYPGRTRQQPADMFMVLDVPDIHTSAAQLTNRGATPTAIKSVPFGQAFNVADPEGNQIEIHQAD